MKYLRNTALYLCVLILLPVVALASQPIIGVSGSGPQSKSVRFIFKTIHELGGYPVLLNLEEPEKVSEHLDKVHGVVIAGNSLDINPADYGKEAIAKTVNEDERERGRIRSDYEYVLIEAVIERNIPFLGICGGMQRLNVANHQQDGGTLIQHVGKQNQHFFADQSKRSPHVPVELIKVKDGTALARVASDPKDKAIDETLALVNEYEENTMHHQTVGRIRAGFRVSATNNHSTIEAIEPDPDGKYGKHPFLLGVQWHPEYAVSPLSQNLFSHYMERVRAYAKEHPVPVEEAKAMDTLPGWLRSIIRQGLI